MLIGALVCDRLVCSVDTTMIGQICPTKWQARSKTSAQLRVCSSEDLLFVAGALLDAILAMNVKLHDKQVKALLEH